MGEPAVPVVMTIAGSDPTGGAGIQADIEAIISMGCHPAPVIAGITVQDTSNVLSHTPVDAELVVQQARVVLEDMPISAIKIGLIGSVEIVEALRSILIDYPSIPVILDPVLAAGGGTRLVDEATVDALVTLLLPLATLVTPNSEEARELSHGSDTLDACAMSLLDKGCEFVLITGAHENTSDVRNRLYGNNRKLETFSWKRLNGSFHGSGCTLSSAIAGLLAQGQEPFTAIHEAQEYTWQALNRGYRVGMGQPLPNRLFWANQEDDAA